MDFNTITVREFAERYLKEIEPKIRNNTYRHKEQILRNHVIPILGDYKMSEVTPAVIIEWQNRKLTEMDEDGKYYKSGYLWTMNKDLNAMFNYAERVYDLTPNPVHKVKKMGSETDGITNFWTLEEYMKFRDLIRPTQYFEMFEILYWGGLRAGEMLSLTRSDFNLNNGDVSVTKSIQRYKGEDEITGPKTRSSVRTVRMPEFMIDEMKYYFDRHRTIRDGERVFPVTLEAIERNCHKYAALADIPDIRVHDLRHSHVSLLASQGFKLFEISKRVGHESEYMTYRYAHLFDEKQQEMVDALSKLGKD